MNLNNQGNVLNENAENRIWGSDNIFRVFLSHKSSVKIKTADLKKKLADYGISCFVAHEDIEPTTEWQNEIETALFSMDGFVAILTDDFHDSSWTDQEVGIAYARKVPKISLKIEKDPYGFLGKYQALKCSWDDAPFEIAKIFMSENKMIDAFIESLNKCANFASANQLSKLIPSIPKSITSVQIKKMIGVYHLNSQIKSSYGFNGKKSHENGEGLGYYLKKTGSGLDIDKLLSEEIAEIPEMNSEVIFDNTSRYIENLLLERMTLINQAADRINEKMNSRGMLRSSMTINEFSKMLADQFSEFVKNCISFNDKSVNKLDKNTFLKILEKTYEDYKSETVEILNDVINKSLGNNADKQDFRNHISKYQDVLKVEFEKVKFEVQSFDV